LSFLQIFDAIKPCAISVYPIIDTGTVTPPSISIWILIATSSLMAAGWLWIAAQWMLHGRELVDLNQVPGDEIPVAPTDGRPQLTVIVPACNEQHAIAATLRSLLASEGIRLQIFAVDDRSTDQTGPIMDSLAAEAVPTPHTLEVIHILQLPPGWLGKPHALATAARRAGADWLLFTDGDVLFAPQAAALALGYAQAQQDDHLVLMPDLTIKSYDEAALHGALHALNAWGLRLWRIRDPKARDFLGVGAFNLVRRSTYLALGGFEALRMEVIEDLRFGWLLKRAGFRQRVALGPGLVSVRWFEGAWGIVRNLEKNFFALFRYNIPLTMLAAFGVAAQAVLPIAALALPGPTRIAGILICVGIAGVYIAQRRVTRVPSAYALAYPLACALFLFAMLRSMVLTLLRGGVIWRGTLYSLKDLRAHAGTSWR